MKIFGLTVGRNEADRYLMPMLLHMTDVVDSHFFYDDRSDDDTAAVATWGGCCVTVRPEELQSFVQDEGDFRNQAWQAFEKAMNPDPGDWVLVIDCDEVLVHTVPGGDVGEVLRQEILWSDKKAIDLMIPEVFGLTAKGFPLVRTDGLWGTIHAPRLFRYQSDGQYFLGDFGVPAVPTYVMGASWGQTERLALMHYGYADDRDKVAKHERYANGGGHNDRHVKSILGPYTTRPWMGQTANGMRRARNG
jgi:hypothetical protein